MPGPSSRAIVAGEAQERQSASAVAFSRTGDPAVGEFEDAVALRQFGEVPDIEDLLAAP